MRGKKKKISQGNFRKLRFYLCLYNKFVITIIISKRMTCRWRYTTEKHSVLFLSALLHLFFFFLTIFLVG